METKCVHFILIFKFFLYESLSFRDKFRNLIENLCVNVVILASITCGKRTVKYVFEQVRYVLKRSVHTQCNLNPESVELHVPVNILDLIVYVFSSQQVEYCCPLHSVGIII